MVTTAFERGSVQDGPETAHDRPLTENPSQEQILGFDVIMLRRLGHAGLEIGRAPRAAYPAVRALDKAPGLIGLVSTLAAMEKPTAVAVEPYLPDIKRVARPSVPGLGTAEFVGKFVPGIKRALDKKVVEIVISQTPDRIEQARRLAERARADAEHLASFQNPQEQFNNEVAILNTAIRESAQMQHQLRVSGSHNGELTEEPSGLFGFVTRVVGSVRSFFSRIFGNEDPEQRKGISARDVGNGIREITHTWNKRKEPGETPLRQRIPMLSRYIEPLLPAIANEHPSRLATVAPELLRTLSALDRCNPSNQALIRSVEEYPHPLRTFAENTLVAHQIRRSVKLLPALRDVLPTSGSMIMETYHELRRLLAMDQPHDTTEYYVKPLPVATPRQKSKPLSTAVGRLSLPNHQLLPHPPQEPYHYQKTRELLKTGKPLHQPWRVVLQRLFGR